MRPELLQRRLLDRTHFWDGLNRDAPTWSHFRDFVERLEKMEAVYQPRRDAYRL